MSAPPTNRWPRFPKQKNGNSFTPTPTQSHPSTSEPVPTSDPLPPEITEIPLRLVQLEPREPLRVINDDPLFDVIDAAEILGISQDLLEKWRQRERGPAYIQYGPGGPVRYELSALRAYKGAYRVQPAYGIRPQRSRP